MKTEFEFRFKSGLAEITAPVGVNFAASGAISASRNGETVSEQVENFRVEIRIVPLEVAERGAWDGSLFLMLAGSPAERGDFAEFLAHNVAELLCFYYKGFHVLGSYITARRIPESEEDEVVAAEAPYAVSLRLREVEPSLPFDRTHLRLFPGSLDLQRTIRQFNVALAAPNKVDGFLGMFKVIETLFHKGKGNAKPTLQASAGLRDLLRRSYLDRGAEPDEISVTTLINDLVDTRDECAHLREHNAFGFAPHDARVFEQVEPLFEILSGAARQAIDERLRAQPLPDLPESAA